MLLRYRAVLLLMVIALALRVWYLSINPLWPQFSDADDGDYFRRALRFAVTGAYVDDAWLIRPPFHVWIFAGWIKLGLLLERPPAFGVQLIQAFQVVLGVIMVPLCYALATRLFDRRAGFIFATFWTIWFPFVEMPATLFSEPIYLFLFALHLWLLLRFDDQGRLRDLVLAGIALGCAALTRSPALYALVFAVPWLFFRSRASRDRRDGAGDQVYQGARGSFVHHSTSLLVPLAVLAACTLVVVLPWTARNWIEYRRLILIDTLGPINLWLDLDEASARNEKIARLRALPQADRQAYAMTQVRAILRDDPLRPLREVWPTFRHIWKAQYVEDFWVKRSFFTRPLREAAPLGLSGDAIWLMMTLAGVAGVLHPRTDRPFKLLVGLWLAYGIATVLVFHVEPRYLLSIWLLLGLYGSWTLASGLGWLRALGERPLRGALVVGVVSALLVLILTYRDYPAIIARGVERERFMRQGDRAFGAGDVASAEQAYRAALQADPGMVETEIALALALTAQGRYQDALHVLESDDSRRSTLVVGALHRLLGDEQQARATLSRIEGLTGEDTQRWAMAHLPREARPSLQLGDDALDLGYIVGFSGSERHGARTFRWLQGDGAIVLALSQPLQAGDVVTIELAAPLPLDQPLRVMINDQVALSFWPAPDWRLYRFVVPPALSGAHAARIRLTAGTFLPERADPTSDDPRALSVMIHRVAVSHVSATTSH